jgi:hypothetical protein
MGCFHSLVVPALLMTLPATNGHANVITDWDATGVAIVQGNAPVPPPPLGPIGGLRIMTVMHIAMFETVNAIDPRYEPYRVDETQNRCLRGGCGCYGRSNSVVEDAS